MDENERKDLIRSTLQETLKAIGDFDVGFKAVIQHMRTGKMKEGCTLLGELLTVENNIAAFLLEISRDLGPAYFEIRAEGKTPTEVREKWLTTLEHLKKGVRDRDWSRTGDILSGEIPAGIENTRRILQGALELI